MQIKAIMKDSASSRMLVLFIDQMEELFTAQDPQKATIFLSALYQATQEQALWVIGTIRSDHLHYCHRHPEMVKVLNGKGHYALGPVKPYMMQDMILKPAHAAGLTITEAFANGSFMRPKPIRLTFRFWPLCWIACFKNAQITP